MNQDPGNGPRGPMDDQLKRQQQLYDHTWRCGLEAGKEQRGNLQANLEFLDRLAILRPSHTILEIGCGIGSVVAELSRRGFDVTGTDISREAVAYGLKKYGNIKLEVHPAEALPYRDGSFDVVLSFDLLEHIARVDLHLAEVARVLKPGGCYLFETPNKFSNALFETIAHRSLKWRRAHPSLHSPGQLKRRLARHGFETRFVKVNPINDFTLAKIRKRLGPVVGVFRHVNFERLPLCLQTNLYVVARKPPAARQE